MKRVPTNEVINMPAKTAIPNEIRLAAPAPLETTNGKTPRMNANEVIRIGRRRTFPASMAASEMGFPAVRIPRSEWHSWRLGQLTG